MNPLKTPSQDAQGRWDELLSPNQILTAHIQPMPSTTMMTTTKKKKCHGNRKEQHKRRRLRRREQKQQQDPALRDHLALVDGDVCLEEINTVSSITIEINEQQRSEKRKQHHSSQDDRNINRSFSQLSISKGHASKKKRMVHPPKIESFKPRYLQVNDRIFKEMLSNAIAEGEEIIKCLDTVEKLHFIRRITESINQVEYFHLQQHLWEDYYNVGLKTGQWSAARPSKLFAREHYLSRQYGYPQLMVEKRLKNIQHQLERSQHELQLLNDELEQYSKQWETTFDANRLSQAMFECVKQGQQRLRFEFDYRRKTFELNTNDHLAIEQFYECQPNSEQIELVKKIWHRLSEILKMKEYEEILRKRIYLQRLPSDMDRMINQSLHGIEQLLSNSSLNQDRRARLISTCSKTITQYKFDLMTMNLETIDAIRQEHETLLDDFQKQLEQPSWNEKMKHLIEQRRQIMIQRYELNLQQKLKTFLDEAPMVIEH